MWRQYPLVHFFAFYDFWKGFSEMFLGEHGKRQVKVKGNTVDIYLKLDPSHVEIARFF